MSASDRCDDCATSAPGAAPRFCSVCGRRLDHDGAHPVEAPAPPPGSQRAIVAVFGTAIALMVLAAAAALYVRLGDDDGTTTTAPRPGGAPAAVPPPSAPTTAEAAWLVLAADLDPSVPVTEVATVDGTPTVVGVVEGTPTVWRWLAGTWQAIAVPMALPAGEPPIVGDLVELLDVTGDGHLDAVLTSTAVDPRAAAVLSSHEGGWRSVPFEGGARWGRGVGVDTGRLAVDPSCDGPCAPGAPGGPWFRYDGATGALASTDVEPPRPLSESQVEDAVATLMAAVQAEVGTDAALDCALPEVVAPGATLRCTLQEETPRLVDVVVADDGSFSYVVGDPFEMR